MSDELQVRARLWPRAAALFIDGCLIAFILGTLGVILFAPTGGRVRVSKVLIGSQTCYPKPLPILQELNLPIPADLHPTDIVRCEKTVLGHVHDNRLVVAEITRTDAVTYTRELNFPLDSKGQPTQAFYLDSAASLLFLLYVLVTEGCSGRTLGKDFLDIRVESLAGGRPSFPQALRRLIRFVPIVALEAPSMIAMAGFAQASALFWGLWLAGLMGAAAIQINFVITVRQGILPWHDRFAETQVLKGR